MGRRYEVEIEGKIYHVELRYPSGFRPSSGAGEVLVNGEVVDGWGSSVWGLPKERTFEIAGRKALLRRRGIVLQDLELFVPGAKVRRV
jgi:hypothetical protein